MSTQNTDQLNFLLFKGDATNFQKEFEVRLNAFKKEVETQKASSSNNPKSADQKAELDTLSDTLRKGGKLIPPFYQAKFQKALDELQKKFTSSSKPSFSFSFSKQMKPASTSANSAQAPEKREETLPETKWTICDLKDQKLKHTCDGKHISINNLDNCSIFIPNETPSISYNNSKNCIFIVPTVTGSAHITGCENCKFVFSIKQLRIHQTSRTDFYISVSSDPIIEKCTEMRFAPLNGEESGPWNHVKDFDHPETDSSPNWSAIPEHERNVPIFE